MMGQYHLVSLFLYRKTGVACAKFEQAGKTGLWKSESPVEKLVLTHIDTYRGSEHRGQA